MGISIAWPLKDANTILETINGDNYFIYSYKDEKTICAIKRIILTDDFKTGDKNDYWSAKDGHLSYNLNGQNIIFDSIQCLNGELAIYGKSLTSYQKNGLHEEYLLMPYKPLNKSGKKICYVIATNDKYSEHTIGRLVNSLIKSGVSKQDIVISVSSNKDETVLIDGIKYVYTTYSCFELTALINPGEGYDYTFLLHDTCEVESIFLNQVNQIDFSVQTDIILLNKDANIPFNIAIYSNAFLKEVRSFIIGKNKLTKVQMLMMESGKDRALIDLAKKVSIAAGHKSHKIIEQTPYDVYGTGNKRHVFYYTCVGLKKFSSNPKRNHMLSITNKI